MKKIRGDFPILKRTVRGGKKLVYLDNAATSQKPQTVIDALTNFYAHENANIHRGVHELAEQATENYEAVRSQVQKFIGARLSREIIFTKGTTESINLVAQAWGRDNIGPGDEILLTEMEHHANLVPWQVLAEEMGAALRFIPVTEGGELDLRNIKRYLSERTKLISLVHASNFMGTVNPVGEIISLAKKNGIPVLIDAAQSAPHMRLNVEKLGADFVAFSAHKMLGPLGVGVLYARSGSLDEARPFLSGGSMIKSVEWEKSKFNDLPYRYEAGTQNIAGVIGFGAALSYLDEVGFDKMEAYEKELTEYALENLRGIGAQIYGPAGVENRIGVISFDISGIHSHDLATVLDQEGVAIRSGHHCVMPMHTKMKISDSARASLYFYNTKEDIDALLEGISKAREIFSV